MTNPELTAAWAAVPEMAAVEAALASVRALITDATPAGDPEGARQAVIANAVAALCDGEALPKDLGKKAAEAFNVALAAQAEWLALTSAERALKDRLDTERSAYQDDALAVLGERLADILTEVRTIVARSGRIVDGDAAIAAGKTGVDDYGKLRALLARLEDTRAAQRSVLKPLFGDDGNGSIRSEAYARGHDEVTGLSSDPAPADIVPMLTRKAPRDLRYLIWLAECGRAWVPTSEVDLFAERMAPDVGEPDGPVRNYNPRVTPITTPTQPRR